MNRRYARLAIASLAVVISSIFPALPAVAQVNAEGGQALSASATKVQRKEAHKQARAKKNAELKELEANGYNPAARDDINYPDDLQNAERKAAQAKATSN